MESGNPFFSSPSPPLKRGRPRRYPSCLGPSVRLTDLHKKMFRAFRKWFSGYRLPNSQKLWPGFLKMEKEEGNVYTLTTVRKYFREPRFQSRFRYWLKEVWLQTITTDQVGIWYGEYLLETNFEEVGK